MSFWQTMKILPMKFNTLTVGFIDLSLVLLHTNAFKLSINIYRKCMFLPSLFQILQSSIL